MEITKDEIASIIDWLGGKFTKDPDKDQEARSALAKALRHWPPDRTILLVLADLLDPNLSDIGLRLLLKRSQGAVRTMDRLKVAKIIRHERNAGKQMKAAVGIAMDRCGVSRSKALEAHKEHLSFLERWAPKMKALREI